MFLDQIKPVDEAYVGKQPNLLAMEKCIDRLRKKYYTEGDVFDMVLLKNVEGDKDWTRFRELIEEQFGFHAVSLTMFEFMPSGMGSVPNACTIPLHFDPIYMARLRSNLQVSNKFIKYDKKAEFCTLIWVAPKLFFSKELTAGEVLAVILHEVGHNFEVATLNATLPIHYIKAFALWTDLLARGNAASIAMLSAILLNPGRKLLGKIYADVQKDPVLSSINSCLMYGLNYIAIGCGYPLKLALYFCVIRPLEKVLPSEIFNQLVSIAKVVAHISPTQILLAQATYVSEKYSDSFVTLHGYGPEFALAMKKLNTVGDVFGFSEAVQSIPLLGHIFGLNDWIFGHIMAVLDGHPDEATRILTQINVLEADLKNTPMDAKTRKLVNKDIAECRKALKETQLNLNTLKKDAKASEMYSTQTMVFLNNIVTTVFPNGDLRTEIMNWFGMGRDAIVKSLNRKKEKPNSWF